jgi:hypothetical protein
MKLQSNVERFFSAICVLRRTNTVYLSYVDPLCRLFQAQTGTWVEPLTFR